MLQILQRVNVVASFDLVLKPIHAFEPSPFPRDERRRSAELCAILVELCRVRVACLQRSLTKQNKSFVIIRGFEGLKLLYVASEMVEFRDIRALVHNTEEYTILLTQEPISIACRHRHFVQIYRQLLYNNNGRS
jgi:hypothetical protein